MFQSIDIVVCVASDMSQTLPAHHRTNRLRLNNIHEVLIQLGWNFKMIDATWDGESSWVTLETIQTCIPNATEKDMNRLIYFGKVKSNGQAYAHIKQA